MTLLIPLGLLGLLSIIALIVIYVLKPNYQHKEVSSTYIWKLSLKYRKRRLPTSKLRNIFLIICQVLTLVLGALIMSQPIIRNNDGVMEREVIAVIDASASMRAKNGQGVTRFERAVEKVIDLADSTVQSGGYVSVILAENDCDFLIQKAGLSDRNLLNGKLRELIAQTDDLACSYGKSDLNDAIILCEDIVKRNASASVHLFTDTDYTYVPEDMTLVNVAEEDEWNVAVLNAYTEFEEGYHTFFVELGCYGAVSRRVKLNLAINGANDDGSLVNYSADVSLRDNSVTTVIFRNEEIGEADYETNAENMTIVKIGNSSVGQYNKTCVFAYDDVRITVDEDDSFADDNGFSLYGGRKNQLKIQYASTKKKLFFTALFGVLRKNYAESWDVVVDEVEVPKENPKLVGYDFYLFEGCVPASLPQDGVVYLCNPNTNFAGVTLRDEVIYNQNTYFVQEGDHPITQYIDAAKICIQKCTRLVQYDSEMYTPLWSVDSNPVLLINDGEKEKVIVSLFDVEWSNITIRNDFAFLFNNIFNTFIPATVAGNAFEVGQEIKVNARGNSLTVSRNSGSDERTITALPSYIQLDTPDTYRFSQVNYFGDRVPDDYIFVKVPSEESNIFATGVSLRTIYRENEDEDAYQDLLVYFAAAMLALLFTEWFLQTHDAV